MKKLSFAIALLLMATLVSAQTEDNAGKQKKSKTTVEQPVEKVQIEFESLVMDFGDIQKTTSAKPVETVFRFKNAGKIPVQLTNVRATCGCTVPDEWTKGVLLPGEKGEIKVQYNNTHIAGPFSKSITVSAGTPPSAQIEKNQAKIDELQKIAENNPKKSEKAQKQIEKLQNASEEIKAKEAAAAITMSITIKGKVIETEQEQEHDHSDPNHTH